MNVLETEWWTIAIPPQWWADTEEEGILIGDRDEVGCIEISTLHKESGEFEAAELLAIARDGEEPARGTEWHDVLYGDFAGIGGSWSEEGTAVREWYLANGAMMLYVTYSCAEENAGMDDAAVDELLDTLMLTG